MNREAFRASLFCMGRGANGRAVRRKSGNGLRPGTAGKRLPSDGAVRFPSFLPSFLPACLLAAVQHAGTGNTCCTVVAGYPKARLHHARKRAATGLHIVNVFRPEGTAAVPAWKKRCSGQREKRFAVSFEPLMTFSGTYIGKKLYICGKLQLPGRARAPGGHRGGFILNPHTPALIIVRIS